ncbi:MAG TPA: Coenzyme F420 hydrogenase/dehydrogenase, beta subunit C-terminal domain [Acidimicrobiales bacterium]|jgi:coenzyme F420 hydrogenase subunit beta|nr:Coenzyme F420 hydrogenase/dehydrogenase, beta subunit C-terminal domain [Acidimicrobiales bacterium]
MPPEKPQWAELYREVVTSGLCTGCAGCIVACPHDVLSYDDTGGRYKPFHIDADGGREDCTWGIKGCTMCTRACPRFRLWEPEIETHLFGRERTAEEVEGISSDILLVRATDPEVQAVGQDGGLVSALLIWALEHDVIDAALVSDLEGDGSSWKAVPAVATTRAEVLAAAGSRYTYSANPLAYPKAVEGGAERIALVGMGCQSSAPPVMAARKAGKIARRLSLTIGLMCSKTFDDAIFPELFEAKYGIMRHNITKMNIKGVFQVWTKDGEYHEIPLKEAHAWTREGCTSCPDFAAEHADISTGGIGEFNDWTLTIVRTDKGRELLDGMIADGAVETRPGDEDPGAIALLRKLAKVSRRRWPETAVPMPRRLPAVAPS